MYAPLSVLIATTELRVAERASPVGEVVRVAVPTSPRALRLRVHVARAAAASPLVVDDRGRDLQLPLFAAFWGKPHNGKPFSREWQSPMALFPPMKQQRVVPHVVHLRRPVPVERVAAELSSSEVSQTNDEGDALPCPGAAVAVGPKRGVAVHSDGAAWRPLRR